MKRTAGISLTVVVLLVWGLLAGGAGAILSLAFVSSASAETGQDALAQKIGRFVVLRRGAKLGSETSDAPTAQPEDRGGMLGRVVSVGYPLPIEGRPYRNEPLVNVNWYDSAQASPVRSSYYLRDYEAAVLEIGSSDEIPLVELR